MWLGHCRNSLQPPLWGSTWPNYGGRGCIPEIRAHLSLPSESPSLAGLAAFLAHIFHPHFTAPLALRVVPSLPNGCFWAFAKKRADLSLLDQLLYTHEERQARESAEFSHTVCTHAGGRTATGIPLQQSEAGERRRRIISSRQRGRLRTPDIPSRAVIPSRVSLQRADSGSRSPSSLSLGGSIFSKFQSTSPRPKSTFYVHVPCAGAAVSESPASGCR